MNNEIKAIFDECAKSDGIEVVITSDEIEIYWENIRVKTEPKDFTKLFNAIKLLKNSGAYFA